MTHAKYWRWLQSKYMHNINNKYGIDYLLLQEMDQVPNLVFE